MSKANDTIQFLRKHKGFTISLAAIVIGFIGYKVATKIYKKNNDILIARQQAQITPNGQGNG